MARYENKLMSRVFNPVTGKDVYSPDRGKSYELTNLRFLHFGVDTIRQLYNCSIKQDVLEQISTHFDCYKTDIINIDGFLFKLSSSGKKTGYKYILKNLEMGFVILLKSFYCEADEMGPHMKIECSPQIIDKLGLEKLTNELRSVASLFGDTLEASGVAVHMCVDMKGLDLPEDFETKLVTRSRRSLKVNGISSGHFGVSEASFVHGQGETYTYGNANSLQMCLYNKSREAIKHDKLDFCESIWRNTPSLDDPFTPEYSDGKDGGESDEVFRLEFRVHHSIIKEFENGHYNNTEEIVCIREPKDLKKHLQGLWDYSLNNFRLQHSTRYVHPIWQKLMADIDWLNAHPTFIYKRASKKSSGQATKRNVAMWIGNHMRLAARKGFTPEHVVKHLLTSGLDSDLADYFGLMSFGYHEELSECLYDFVSRRLLDHRLNGVAV